MGDVILRYCALLVLKHAASLAVSMPRYVDADRSGGFSYSNAGSTRMVTGIYEKSLTQEAMCE